LYGQKENQENPKEKEIQDDQAQKEEDNVSPLQEDRQDRGSRADRGYGISGWWRHKKHKLRTRQSVIFVI